jgi:hypothetical protein
MMHATVRLWRAKDGQGLVLDGDPDAATLAYAAGDQVTRADEDKVAALLSQDGDEAETKQADRPADKSRRPAASKKG